MAPSVDLGFRINLQDETQGHYSPQTVEFTNTSEVTDGFARQFMWDFGDGTFSEEENPTHTYTGPPGTVYNPRLTILATTLIDTTIVYSESFPTLISNQVIRGGNADYDIAWVARSPAVGDDQFVTHMLNHNGVSYNYVTNFPTLQFTTGQGDVVLSVVMLRLDANINRSYLSGTIDVGGRTGESSGLSSVVWEVVAEIPNLTASNPVTVECSVIPESPLPIVFGGSHSGIKVQLKSRAYHNTADQISSKSDPLYSQVLIDVEAWVDFVGTPLSGTDPLAVQFTDLSVVDHAFSTWNFGDGNTASFAGQTHPLNTYTTDACSLALL